MKKKLLFTLLIIASGYNTVFAQQPAVIVSDKKGWHKIAETTADFKKDRDEVVVMGADKFSALKFEVTDAAIDLQDLEVYYENGPKEDISVHTPLTMGHESRTIDLKGRERALKKIVFIYKTIPDQKDVKAHVIIWGLKTNADKAEMNHDHAKGDHEMPTPGVVVSDKPGWHRIAETHVDLKLDRDEVKVMGKDQFKQIKLKAEDAAIEFNDIEVYFENDNTPQKIHVGMILKAGEETRNIDLEGRNKPINKIVFMYKTAPNQQKEKAEVVIYGLK